mmetsp:Transcript_84204/g.234862  ORF Transcript_84204/g.234862 Transcript_84204/m.234862 type:complete len:222 (+) Transcript_84204:116-781(+)
MSVCLVNYTCQTNGGVGCSPQHSSTGGANLVLCASPMRLNDTVDQANAKLSCQVRRPQTRRRLFGSLAGATSSLRSLSSTASQRYGQEVIGPAQMQARPRSSTTFTGFEEPPPRPSTYPLNTQAQALRGNAAGPPSFNLESRVVEIRRSGIALRKFSDVSAPSATSVVHMQKPLVSAGIGTGYPSLQRSSMVFQKSATHMVNGAAPGTFQARARASSSLSG